MDRSQNFSLNISPSVPRTETGATDAGQIGSAWDELWQSTNSITYQYREVTWDFRNGKDGFGNVQTGTLTESDFNGGSNGTYATNSKLKNVRSINFNLPAEDIILVNGIAYQGNEDIPIDADQFLNDNITFYYYDSEYVTSQNTMVASIARVDRYIDLNDDGVVEGTIDPDTGAFVPDPDSEKEYVEGAGDNTDATYYQLPSLTDEYYSISELAPWQVDGKYHQIVLKVYYSMLPRSLVVPAGASESDTAEVIPALVTTVTSPSVRSTMTDEQLGYRYIDHGGTGAGKTMYGATASAISFVDIPLGGDHSPATITGSGDSADITWTPTWKGNPYGGSPQFADPDPIYLDGTALGDFFPVGEVSASGGSVGELTESGKTAVNAYLSSMHENDTFALCVRETPRSTADTASLLRSAPAARTTPEGDSSGTGDTGSGTDNAPTDIESSQTSDTATYPDPNSARETNDPMPDDKRGDKFDSSDSGAPLSEFGMSGQINLPEIEIGISDFVTIAMNGLELGITVGANMFGLESQTSGFNNLGSMVKKPTFNGVQSSNEEGIGKAKEFYNNVFGDGNYGDTYDEAMENLKNEKASFLSNNPGQNPTTLRSGQATASVVASLTILLKYDPVENRFFLNQLMIAFTGSVTFSYTLRLSVCPIFYLCMSASLGVEVATGLEATRVKEIGESVNLDGSNKGDFTYYANQDFLGYTNLDEPEDGDFIAGAPGSTFTFKTKEKAIDITFCGTLYIEIETNNWNSGIGGDSNEKYRQGTIHSAGDEPVTIKLADKVNGVAYAHEAEVTFTVVNDGRTRGYKDENGSTVNFGEGWAVVDKIETIKKQTSDVHFAGIIVSPELALEVSVGADLAIAKVELFLNISVGCSFAFAQYQPPEQTGESGETEAFVFNEFSMAISFGLRAQLLLFTFELNILQFTVTYDREARYDEDLGQMEGWNVVFYVVNRPVAGDYSRARSAPAQIQSGSALEPNIILPGEQARDETLHTLEESPAARSGISLFAFEPSDPTVPFEYSDYSGSGDAFALGSDLTPGSTYELVTVDETNYIVYTVTDPNAEGINQSRLVLSKVAETTQTADDDTSTDDPGTQDTVSEAPEDMGLVHPTDGTGTYLVLDADTDTTGDLDFDAWVDEHGKIHVAWVSYTDAAADAYNAALADPAETNKNVKKVNAMAAAAKCTEVKTVTVDVTPNGNGKGEVQVVSANADGHGAYFSPSGAGDMVFYAEADHYSPEELATYLSSYQGFLGDSAQMTPGDTITNGDEQWTVSYGTGDPTIDYQLLLLRAQAQVYGKGFTSYFAYPDGTGYTVSGVKQNANSRSGSIANLQLENASLSKIGEDYYLAYSTADSALEDSGESTDQRTVRKLYLQKITVAAADNDAEAGGSTPPARTATVTPGDEMALRTVVDYSKDSGKDGVYAEGERSEPYQDPYFANVQFLRGKLGDLSGGTAADIDTLSDDSQDFLIFEMNGNTYVVPQNDLVSIGGGTSGSIYPFFTRLTADQLKDPANEGKDAPAVTSVTFGADGKGNIAAVYTRSSGSVPGNAVYLTKYDPATSTWGLGTRLAMQNLSVIEKAEADGLTAEETAAAYYDTDGDGKADTSDSPSSFTFNRLRVGFASMERLLILAEGTNTKLEAAPQMEAITEEGTNQLKGVRQAKDESGNLIYTFQPKMNEAGTGYDASSGVYALSFGAGQQSIGSAALQLSNYDFTPGSTMTASVSFVNNGDVAIRASESQPATVTLNVGKTQLTTWNINDHVRAGQEVTTTPVTVTMPTDIETGDKIYFTVNEDNKDLSGGGNAFSASTITGENEDDTAACITVADHAELGYEDFSITMVGADENNVTLAADIHVGNRGTAASQDTYLRFQYEKAADDGTVTLSPVDLTGHSLSVSEQQEISRFARARTEPEQRTLENGYLPLRTNNENTSEIKSMHGRTVTGTFTVPKSCYDTDTGSGSLNLRVTIESYPSGSSSDAATEYNSDNNLRFCSVEQKTLFSTAYNVQMQVGSSLRLPVAMQTSAATTPTITVTELHNDNGLANEADRHLSVLYYDANQGAVVVMAAREGQGVIRVADTATNSFHDICYNIEGEGVGLNIFDDNGIFTWYDAGGAGGDTGHDAWEFVTALKWTDDSDDTVPMRNDLAIADAGESFSFQTYADSIDLYFMGESRSKDAKVTVHSNLAGFADQTLTSNHGETPQKVNFNNEESVAHTVTITVVDGPVRFDRLLEHFLDDLEIRSDGTAPNVYYSRSLPGTASIPPGTGEASPFVPLNVYFADLGGLASVTMNGQDYTTSSELQKDGDELWSLPLNITEDGSYRFVVRDGAGNETIRQLTVDWFSNTAVTEEDQDPGAPALNVELVDAAGSSIAGMVPGNVEPHLKASGADGAAVSGAVISRFQYTGTDAAQQQDFVTQKTIQAPEDNPGVYPLSTGAGIYRIAVTDKGVTSYRYVNVRQDPAYPRVTLTESSDGTALTYTAEKLATQSSGSGSSLITKLTINDVVLFENSTGQYRVEGSIPLTHGGTYVLEATDGAGNVSQIEVTVDADPVSLPADAVTVEKVTEAAVTDPATGETAYTSNADGKVTIDVSKVTGGVFDKDATDAANQSDGTYRTAARYEFALLPVTDGTVPVPDGTTTWSEGAGDSLTFDKLETGGYVLYVRDKNAPDNLSQPISIMLELDRVIIQNVAATNAPGASITVTATGGTGDLEYSIYSTSLLDAGVIRIDNNGTPGDDRDDTVQTVSGALIASRPLWQSDNTLADLPAGTYLIRVRDPQHINNIAEQTVTIRQPSGGSGGATRYPPIMTETANGSVTVTPAQPAAGQTVTITPVPDEGYEVGTVTVTDSLGNTVTVTDNGDGTWSFRQPGSKVTIAVTFEAAGSVADCLRDGTCPMVRFDDVDLHAWYHDIHYCVEHGLMAGTSATTFSPEATTSRAMIAVILWRLEGSPATSEYTDFSDVADGTWYTEGVRWASSVGVVSGYPNGSFGPNDPITREQMAAMLYRYADHKGWDVTELADLSAFTDTDGISGYAITALRWATAAGTATAPLVPRATPPERRRRPCSSGSVRRTSRMTSNYEMQTAKGGNAALCCCHGGVGEKCETSS